MQYIGLHFDELHDRIAAKPAPIQNERRVVRGRCVHRHRHLIPMSDRLAPVPQSHPLVHARDIFILGLQPAVPVQPCVIVEGSLGEIAAEAVVNLPRNQLRMLSQRLRHVLHDALGVVPKFVAVQADGASGAFMLHATLFIERENFRMLLREPDWRGGGGGAEDDFNAGLAENIHHPVKPVEVKLAILRFTQSPGKFADANDVDARLDHEYYVPLPCCFGIFGGSTVRKDPLLGMVINAKIHRVNSRVVPRV
ncbi:MAG: hypothetical protein WDM80_13590 [Limisphaerales bacterium]